MMLFVSIVLHAYRLCGRELIANASSISSLIYSIVSLIASLMNDVNWTFAVDSTLSFPLLLDLKEDLDLLLLLFYTMICIYNC
jgi:hypothetical protein